VQILIISIFHYVYHDGFILFTVFLQRKGINLNLAIQRTTNDVRELCAFGSTDGLRPLIHFILAKQDSVWKNCKTKINKIRFMSQAPKTVSVFIYRRSNSSFSILGIRQSGNRG